MDIEEAKKAEGQWPSVDTAFDIVKPSYDWLLSRFDAVNGRIQPLLTFSATLTVATPVFVKTLFPDVDFASPLFIAAIVAFVLTAIVGTLGNMITGVQIMNPQKLYDRWLSWPTWEFKKNAIYWAGRDFNANASKVNKKGNCLLVVNGLLVLEVLLVVCWVAVSA
jgi:hypothetical protein